MHPCVCGAGVYNFNDHALGFLPLVYTLAAAGPDATLIAGVGAATSVGGARQGYTQCTAHTVQVPCRPPPSVQSVDPVRPVCGTGARAFFLSYYYTTQLLMYNVLISFVISSYTLTRQVYDVAAARREATGEEHGRTQCTTLLTPCTFPRCTADSLCAPFVCGTGEEHEARLDALYSSLPKEEGWAVVAVARDATEMHMRRMFQSEIEVALRDARHKLRGGVGATAAASTKTQRYVAALVGYRK